jgi:hypothetical protein
MAPWCSGLTCHPVTVEIRGSNPLGVGEYKKGDLPVAFYFLNNLANGINFILLDTPEISLVR